MSFAFNFVKVELLDTGEKSLLLAEYRLADEDEECEALFGDPEDSDSFAFLLQRVFNIMKYAGPLLCIIFSCIDFVKVVVSDDKDAMSKTIKKCLTRVVLALVLFFIPTVINFLFPLLGFYGTCGIN
jgi:hypothetical protein